MIDIFALAKWLTAIGTICALLLAVYTRFSELVLKRIAANEKEVKELKAWTTAQQQDIKDAIEGNILLLRATRVGLEALKNGVANGNVTKAVTEITEYLEMRASSTKSGTDFL